MLASVKLCPRGYTFSMLASVGMYIHVYTKSMLASVAEPFCFVELLTKQVLRDGTHFD